MKKIILVLSLIFTTSLFAQYNLEFSQAINRHLDTGEELTVPEGKVWKIQDWMNGDEQEYGDPGTISIISPAGEGTTYQGHWNGLHSKPLWVPAQYKVGGTNGQRTSINILEFSLITAGSSSGGGSVSGVSADDFAASGIINLEFGPVFNSGSWDGNIFIGSITVPEGKIWKLMTGTGVTSDNSSNPEWGEGYDVAVYVDGYLVASSGSSNVYLSEGTYDIWGDPGVSGGADGNYTRVKVGGIAYNAN